MEPGASATNDRRPGFQRMIEAGASKPAPFDVVIVHSFSRFFRDHFELEFYVRKLAKNGVRLVSITQEMGGDPMHMMMHQIMALFDEYQSKENAKHVMRALKENARQGPTGCAGMAAPMEKLDDLVASHLEDRLLQPDRLEAILAAVIDRRQARSARQREHIGELNRRAAESELRLKQLYNAIEGGVADIDDPALKDRIDGLKAIREQARADAERAQAMLQHSGSHAVTPLMLQRFARTARERMRLPGGYCRDHLRAIAQRVEVSDEEVSDGEVRIIGSKSRLLQTLVTNGSANAVPTQGLKWR